MSKISFTGAVLLVGFSALLASCGRPATKTETAAAPAVAGPVPAFSVNELMVMIVDRPGERLWDVEKAFHQPKTDEAWYQLENHAVELGSAANLIQYGGTGPSDAGWAKQALWQSSAGQLITSAAAARQAAHAKDLKALIVANSQIVEACEACHKQFKPDLPTGGLFMHQPIKDPA